MGENKKMTQPFFSIISAAVRNHLYEDFYNNISYRCNIPFEVIFVGDKPPLKQMPPNFHYVYTEVKASQCLEIAARNAKGDFLINSSDDIRYSGDFLNLLNFYLSRLDHDKTFITFHENKNYYRLILNKRIPTAPIIGICGVFRKDLWHFLGGIDKRFIGSWADLDLQMRFREYGMNIFFPPGAYFSDICAGAKTDCSLIGNPTLYKTTGKQGRKLMHSFWFDKDNIFSKKRLSPVMPFIDKDILEINQ